MAHTTSLTTLARKLVHKKAIVATINPCKAQYYHCIYVYVYRYPYVLHTVIIMNSDGHSAALQRDPTLSLRDHQLSHHDLVSLHHHIAHYLQCDIE